MRITFRMKILQTLRILAGSIAFVLKPLTLEQVGQVIGVTKERVRQIQNKALEKIRWALQSANPEAAGEMAADIAARDGRIPYQSTYPSN